MLVPTQSRRLRAVLVACVPSLPWLPALLQWWNKCFRRFDESARSGLASSDDDTLAGLPPNGVAQGRERSERPLELVLGVFLNEGKKPLGVNFFHRHL
jgi:hypothetical protein